MSSLAVADEMSAANQMHGSARNRQSTIRTGDLVVDLETRVVSVHDRPVRLTGKEYCIFEVLSLRKGALVSKQMLLDHLYGGVDPPELKIIDVFVCHLCARPHPSRNFSSIGAGLKPDLDEHRPGQPPPTRKKSKSSGARA